MARPFPTLSRKSSAPWDRLRPSRQDPLESMGFVSKGDTRLLDAKTQEAYYHKIVNRYMQFCTRHSKDLDAAFASLSVDEKSSASSDPTSNPPLRAHDAGPMRSNPTATLLTPQVANKDIGNVTSGPAPEDELSLILMSLRKLREGVLGSSNISHSPVFSQRVHVFNIRLAILASHPPSYHPSLSYLLFVLHTPEHPLPESELVEMTTYAILDRALRQNDLIAAYALRLESRQKFGYHNRDVDVILKAVVNNNWVAFWRMRRKVDGYVRALMQWYTQSLRNTTLKAFGRAYLKTNKDWILRCATGSQLSWEQLVESEQVGWIRDGDTITIRKPKAR